jgi:hypothetical protein
MNRRQLLIGTAAIGAATTLGRLPIGGSERASAGTFGEGKWSIEIDGVFFGPFGLSDTAPISIPFGRQFFLRTHLPKVGLTAYSTRLAKEQITGLSHDWDGIDYFSRHRSSTAVAR